MEFKGTKETWHLEKDIPMFDGGYRIYWNRICMKDNEILIKGKDFNETSANAKLIVCAPELLEMLIKAHNMCDKLKFPIEDELREFAKESLELIKRATE